MFRSTMIRNPDEAGTSRVCDLLVRVGSGPTYPPALSGDGSCRTRLLSYSHLDAAMAALTEAKEDLWQAQIRSRPLKVGMVGER
jgi:hypothetical protein